MYTPSEEEIERRNRILVALWAYAYEIMGTALVSDQKYDELCLKIRPSVKTGNDILDAFFEKEFTPHSGMWVHKHPEFRKLANLYGRLKRMGVY
jgi:hypothetical protein